MTVLVNIAQLRMNIFIKQDINFIMGLTQILDWSDQNVMHTVSLITTIL